MDVGSRKWSKPADGVDELEWSQERWKQPSQSPCPALQVWQRSQFSSISTGHRLGYLAFTGMKAEAEI